jgi:hypothetical protein
MLKTSYRQTVEGRVYLGHHLGSIATSLSRMIMSFIVHYSKRQAARDSGALVRNVGFTGASRPWVCLVEQNAETGLAPPLLCSSLRGLVSAPGVHDRLRQVGVRFSGIALQTRKSDDLAFVVDGNATPSGSPSTVPSS